ncbi:MULTISPECIES: hypothetical protein [Rhodococcus]|jgi:hypothetical protein|uniref:Uncharacterized protein n=1 Tax=Rhodococcus oxybenzonivorans TaxID=1990687 RepID=A0AAE4UW70_9NOCA|nr:MULTISPECIES: hypothetical protein [Rhodococcus]MDV7243881.1 hypothetical protein [Rhodococcus oxybenzonivorans]MDV7263860.1 hypothetical protein [Rhodococcus oxybenzonivorans]MDV7274877.1 hypothetical protein [Rhodococcus oxybenzonivorans]MDV7335116.1 hypothetical protein [Rhodococcus oxybenzonivorans]MDV7345827.1 hypothetical protein [Rhodococcus oxybenzonivorans]
MRRLSVQCGTRTDEYSAGFTGHVLDGGALRILAPDKQIAASYPAASWTILAALPHDE